MISVFIFQQEVYADPSRDESLIFELLDLKVDVADNSSATWFLQDLASEQDVEGTIVILHSPFPTSTLVHLKYLIVSTSLLVLWFIRVIDLS